MPLSSEPRPKRPHKHKDPTNHDFWYPPYLGPWNQNVSSYVYSGALLRTQEPSCAVEQLRSAAERELGVSVERLIAETGAVLREGQGIRGKLAHI